MPKNNIDKSLTDSTTISTDCQQVTFNAVRKILPDSMIERACVDVDYHYRRRRITPIITVLHMIMTALWPEESFNACWHVLWDSFVSW